jgi:alcohol dehydrogenase class IV
VGYTEDDLDDLTDKAFPQKRLIDNAPMPVSREQLRDLFESAMVYW